MFVFLKKKRISVNKINKLYSSHLYKGLNGFLMRYCHSQLEKTLPEGSYKKILEIGTFTGYSTLCLAEGLDENGEIHTVDINEELFDLQRKYFKKSSFNNNITQHLGNALDIIPKLDRDFDLIFLDADKINYPKYLDILIVRLKKGGVLLSDNVLWDGKVLNEISHKDKSTKAIVKYNELLNNRSDMDSVILPIRDGITISRKKK